MLLACRAQFADPRECDAIKKSGLHHVRYAQRDGTRGLALAIGGIIAAMPMVVRELQGTDGQRLVVITAIDPRRRYEITDPQRIAPSPYWPRWVASAATPAGNAHGKEAFLLPHGTIAWPTVARSIEPPLVILMNRVRQSLSSSAYPGPPQSSR
jgi:hypothetical protein